MKTLLLTTLLALGIITFFNACEKNDYQHPGYRSGKVK